MAFSGFTDKAKKRFKRNQEYEKKTREENRFRRQKSRDGVSTYIPSSSSISVPDFVPAKQPIPGLIPRHPRSTEGNRVQAASPSASVLPVLSKVESEAAISSRISRSGYHTRPRPPRSQSEPQVNSHHSNRPTAFPATIHDSNTVRVPTAEAPLMDPQRTLIEGLRVPTHLQTLHSR